MTQQHPITPPPELVRHWSRFQGDTDPEALWFRIANEAAQWGADQQLKLDAEQIEKAYQAGADQELEACYEWLRAKYWICPDFTDELRAARRPKPPSLKEQALALVEQHEDGWRPSPKDWDTIRRALEALPDSIVVFPSQC